MVFSMSQIFHLLCFQGWQKWTDVSEKPGVLNQKAKDFSKSCMTFSFVGRMNADSHENCMLIYS